MRKFIVFLSLLLIPFVSLTSAQAQHPQRIGDISLSCQGTVVQGCVGECAPNFSESHVITQDDVDNSLGKDWAVMCLKVTASNLCPNTGAEFVITNNGIPISKGDLTEGDKGFAIGEVGDVIRLDVNLVNKNNDIVCIQLGETSFNMGYIQLSR